ncbi:hypothetical protein [Flavobacterium bizetiae]|uniref:hypothetical protein n=1 Tax=Flavobacterium bizetiae TaxID=2704140 RepID=UPI00375766BF
MALQTLNTIKQWFKTGLKPTQTQFWDTWDSFRHKYDKVPVKDVEGIDELLLSKADKVILDNHLADKIAHAPQVNTDWNSESGFSQLINKPEFKTINGKTVLGHGDLTIKEGGVQDLDQTLANGTIANLNGGKAVLLGKDKGDEPLTSINYEGGERGANFTITEGSVGFSASYPNQKSEMLISGENVQIYTQNTRLEFEYGEDDHALTVVRIPNIPTGGVYTLATTSDFKTINGETIVGEGDIAVDIESQGLKSVLDTDPTASYGESSATIMGNGNNNSKYNDFTVSDQTDKTVILQLKNQVSLDHTLLDSNDISNITLSEGNIKLTREKSNNQTVVDISDPVANTHLRFPAKSEEGKEYTIATTDDFKTINGESIVGEGDITVTGGSQTLDQVLATGSIAYDKNLVLSSKGAYVGLSFGSYNSSVNPNLTTTASLTMLNSNEDLSPKGGTILSVHPESTGLAKYTFKEYKGDRDFILATTEDFKTINGQSIVGEGDILIGGGGSQNLQQTLENGGNVRESNIPLSIRMDNYGNAERPFDASNDIRPGVIGVSKLNKNDFHINGSAYLDVEFGNTKQDGYGLLNLSRQGADLSFVTSRLLASKSPSGLEASFYLPSTKSSYLSQTLAVSVNGVKANDYGEIVIPIGGGSSQNLQQTLNNGKSAVFNNKQSISFFDPNIIDDKTFRITSMNDSSSAMGSLNVSPDVLQLANTNSSGLSGSFAVANGKLSINQTSSSTSANNILEFEEPLYNTKIKVPAKEALPVGKYYTLATTSDFKTVNGESIVGTGDIIVAGTTPDATAAVKGIVKLTGDLGGTADNPTTPTAVHKTGSEFIAGTKTIYNSAASPSVFQFTTMSDATTTALGVSGQSATQPALRVNTGASGGTGLLVVPFNNSATGIKIEPYQNNPTSGSMLTLSNKRAVNGSVDISTPLTVLRDGVKVATISDLGVINASGANFTGNGAVNISNLSGVGTRTVVADVNGNLSAVNIAPTSGTYTPTLTNSINVSGSTLQVGSGTYTRVGDIVTVNLSITVTVTAASTYSVITATLPINRTSTTSTPSGSGIANGNSLSNAHPCLFQLSNNTTQVDIASIPPTIGLYTYTGSFSYKVN